MPASGIHPMCMACFSAQALNGPTSYFHVPMEIHPVVHYCRDDMIFCWRVSGKMMDNDTLHYSRTMMQGKELYSGHSCMNKPVHGILMTGFDI